METSFANTSVSSVEDDCGHDRGSSHLESTLLYVEQELHTLALPSIIGQNSTELDKTRAIAVLQKLLLLHRQNLKVISELQDNLTRGKSDVLMQREAQARLKEDIKSGEKELAQLEDRERQLTQKIKSLTSKLRAEQDEVRRLKVSMQYKETQRIHESKKKEKEFDKLKLKLAQLVSDKNNERRLGMSMLNALHKTDGKRKMWTKPGSGDEDMYRVLISNYEDRQKELMLENSSLRESLAGMEKQLVYLLNEKQATVRDQSEETVTDAMESDSATVTESSIITSGHFQMPYDIVRNGIEQNFQEKCEMIKRHIDDLKLRIERSEDNPDEDHIDNESEIRKLEHKLFEYRSIIGQQEEMLLQKSADPDERKQPEMLRESFVWQEKNRLEEEKQIFLEQKDNLEKQRQKYMEAVHKLEGERRNFEEEKIHFFQDQESLLNSTHDLDSFFAKLCSTPGQKSDVNLSKYLPNQRDHGGDTSGCSSSVLQDSSMVHQEVDLKHDLSLCSDDGVSILNERPATTESLNNNTE